MINGGSGLIVDSNGLILTNAHIVHKPNIKVVVSEQLIKFHFNCIFNYFDLDFFFIGQTFQW